MNEKLKNHKFIVWGFEHYNPLGIVRSLGEEGIRPYTIIIKSSTESITSASKYVKKNFFVETVDDGYRVLLDNFGHESQKPFIITSDDTITSFLDTRYEEIKEKFICFNAEVAGRVSFFMNKNHINELALKHGLNVLQTYIVKKGEIPDHIQFPVITKALSSITPGWKEDVHICNNIDELKAAYKHIKSEKILLQKYIIKKNELCLDGFSIAHGTEFKIAIASTYNSVNTSTFSSNMTIFKLDNSVIEEALGGMLREVGFEGIWSVEFLIDENDELYFLEINFRNSTWSYAATCLGMNMIMGWSNGMLEGHIVEGFEKKIPHGYMAIAEFPDFRDRVKTHRISAVKWMKELRLYSCKFLYNRQDNKPFWNTVKAIFVRKFKKIFR